MEASFGSLYVPHRRLDPAESRTTAPKAPAPVGNVEQMSIDSSMPSNNHKGNGQEMHSEFLAGKGCAAGHHACHYKTLDKVLIIFVAKCSYHFVNEHVEFSLYKTCYKPKKEFGRTLVCRKNLHLHSSRLRNEKKTIGMEKLGFIQAAV